MAGPYDHLIGELTPGDKGWLPLDDTGTPNGPATLKPPPELNAKAASVMANAKDPLGPEDHALVSSSGAPLDPPLTSNVDRRVTPGESEVPQAPVVYSLTPNTAVANDPADITMIVNGSGFTEESVIVFNGYDEPTTFISETGVSTGVKPSIFEVEAVCPVLVRNGTTESNSAGFTFTPPVGRSGRSRR